MPRRTRGPRYSTILRLSRPNTKYGNDYVPPDYDFLRAFVSLPVVKYDVPRKLLKIRTMGIRRLAMPHQTRPKFIRPVIDERYPAVCPAALKYKPTRRLLVIARPKKKYVDPNLRKNPYEVPKRSLKPLVPRLEKIFKRLATPQHKPFVGKLKKSISKFGCN